jgi:hypothetical protein
MASMKQATKLLMGQQAMLPGSVTFQLELTGAGQRTRKAKRVSAMTFLEMTSNIAADMHFMRMLAMADGGGDLLNAQAQAE